MIRLEDLFVVFNPGTLLERVAVRGVNFTAQDGEVISILGNNGSGRSTLLRFLAGHIKSSFGKLWLDKTDITSQTLAERSAFFSGVFYDHDLTTAGNLTVLENLAIASIHHQERSLIEPAIPDGLREALIKQLRDLNFMEMEDLVDEKAVNISKTYRQVLGLMIAVIKGAQVLLIDEHSTGLDKESSRALLATTEKIIRSKKITTIMVVSDPKFAIEASDRIIVLNGGQVALNLGGEEKKNIKLEDLFASFNIPPQVKDIKLPVPQN
ncbi:MAG: ATP-binding cassette domain-containing protein [Holosporaceae bacterium]|jgi:putative ABC transport system ATP-binding protein|nr:ATP-binding cassette domain-containing protein [Holosporaceae bacterium]